MSRVGADQGRSRRSDHRELHIRCDNFQRPATRRVVTLPRKCGDLRTTSAAKRAANVSSLLGRSQSRTDSGVPRHRQSDHPRRLPDIATRKRSASASELSDDSNLDKAKKTLLPKRFHIEAQHKTEERERARKQRQNKKNDCEVSDSVHRRRTFEPS
jgi:hypothetical protein